MPGNVIEAARGQSDRPRAAAVEHLARVDQQLHQLEDERRQVSQERRTAAETERKLRAREESVRERESALKRRLDAGSTISCARRAARSTRCSRVSRSRAVGTVAQARRSGAADDGRRPAQLRDRERAPRSNRLPTRVTRRIGGSQRPGLRRARRAMARWKQGHACTWGRSASKAWCSELHGKQAEVEVRGKRLRAPLRDLQVIGWRRRRQPAGRASTSSCSPREGLAHRAERHRLHR